MFLSDKMAGVSGLEWGSPEPQADHLTRTLINFEERCNLQRSPPDVAIALREAAMCQVYMVSSVVFMIETLAGSGCLGM